MEKLSKCRGLEPVLLSFAQMKTELNSIWLRRMASRTGSEISFGDLDLDGADVLLLDYDLVELGADNGESVAYQVRCFTTCGPVYILDQYPRLANVRGGTARRLKAERIRHFGQGFRIGDDVVYHIARNCRLFRAVSDLEELSALLSENMDEKIFPWLGIQDFGGPSYESFEFAEVDGKPCREVTFREFAHGCARGRDVLPSKVAPRVAADRLRAWVESMVGRAGAHPFAHTELLLEHYTSLQEREGGLLDAGLEALRPFEFPRPHFYPGRLWFWNGVQRFELLPENSNPWAGPQEPESFLTATHQIEIGAINYGRNVDYRARELSPRDLESYLKVLDAFQHLAPPLPLRAATAFRFGWTIAVEGKSVNFLRFTEENRETARQGFEAGRRFRERVEAKDLGQAQTLEVVLASLDRALADKDRLDAGSALEVARQLEAVGLSSDLNETVRLLLLAASTAGGARREGGAIEWRAHFDAGRVKGVLDATLRSTAASEREAEIIRGHLLARFAVGNYAKPSADEIREWTR